MRKEVMKTAKADAEAARQRAGIPAGGTRSTAMAVNDGEGHAGENEGFSSELADEDDLVDILAILDPRYEAEDIRFDCPAVRALRRPVSDAESLRAIVQQDPRWLETSRPEEPGKFESAAEVAQFAAEEGVALWLRGRNAKLFSVGHFEDKCVGLQGEKRTDGTPIILNLHKMLEQWQTRKPTKTSKSAKMGADKPDVPIKDNEGVFFPTASTKKVNLEDYVRLSRPKHDEGPPKVAMNKDRTQLAKLLHISIDANRDMYEGLYNAVVVPKTLQETNWVGGKCLSKSEGARNAFLQMVLARQDTYYHRDNNGTDTWMRLIAGKVLVACWSLEDGIKHELCDRQDDKELPMRWERFKKMDSARLFLMRGGDALFMPAGTFHYVYTVHTKLVVAGDYLTAFGWRTRVQSMERDLQVLGVRPEIASMATIFKKGVLLTAKQLQESVDRQGEQPARCGAVVSAKGGRLVVGGADDAVTREAERRKRELVCILEWADALKAEARGYECAVTGEQGERRPLSRASQSDGDVVNEPEVRAALNAIWLRLNPGADPATSPWTAS